ncbi:50S ribosomal protein L25/general stress protein Ctc [Kangiella sp. HZ709]|uniref:50S ribosomal protein L25/general stress protein Ctc n=1 Tax=Kangiella sp. HZ709 TaxID=2666328 RepID=UPI0012B0C8BA|nr:50S ribosomal protein L25/general stress protein Ctc [Kangiella sp. HZ709]MRX27494.1 50S ribosomal protein L25/general stress protein Ctc [Kangiella sp. HZ709]
MSDFVLNATKRSDIGKGASRRLRREANMIPAVVYGGKEEAQSLTLNHNQVVRLLEEEAFYSSIITLDVEGATEEVLLKDLQRHPFKPKVLHMDLKRVVRGQEMNANAPLHFINEEDAPGVKEGGVVSHQVTSVEIICMPRNLPEYIEVDMGSIEMGGVVHLSDLTMPEGVRLAAFEQNQDNDASVANIVPPTVSASSDDEATEEAAEDEAPAAEEGGEE